MTQHNMSLLIGDAFSAGPIASILSPFVLGMLVDRFFASQKVMAVMHLAGAAILWFVPGALIAENGALLIGLLFGYTLCYMPTLALTNNIAFHSLANVDKTFPVVRVFGTIGWIVAGIFIGVTGVASSVTIFQVAAASSVLLALYSLTLPHTPAPAKGLPVKVRDLFCADAFALLKTRHFFVFSVCAMLISVPLGTYYAYTASYGGCRDCRRQHRHVLRADVGNLLHAGDPAAVPPPGRESHAADRHAGVVRALRHVRAGRERGGRFLLYIGILLHGVCYDFFFVVGFIYTDRVAGEKVKGQAQSMIVMFTYGIGMLLGSQISGALYNRLVAGQTVPQAWVTFWWIPAVAAAAIALIFLLTFKYDDDKA